MTKDIQNGMLRVEIFLQLLRPIMEKYLSQACLLFLLFETSHGLSANVNDSYSQKTNTVRVYELQLATTELKHGEKP